VWIRFSIRFKFTVFAKPFQIVKGNSVAEAQVFYPFPTIIFLIVEKYFSMKKIVACVDAIVAAYASLFFCCKYLQGTAR
jgi:hypothetical protein